MNLGAPLRWARWCLRVLDQPWPTSAALSDRQRAVLTKILTVTDFGGLDVGIPQAMRRSIDFAANSHGIGAG